MHLYALFIVCSYMCIVCTKHIQRLFQLARCIGFVLLVHYLCVQKLYISSFKLLYSELCTSFVQFVQVFHREH